MRLSGGLVGVYAILYVLNSDAYENRLLPAYRAFTKSGDVHPILQLVGEAKAHPPNSRDDSEVPTIDECREILDRFADGGPANLKAQVEWGNGSERSLTDIVRFNLSSILMRFLCLVRQENRVVEQAVWETEFMQYIYRHSDWLERFFTFSILFEGGLLEIPWGECTELLSRDQARQLLDETRKVPAPPDEALRTDHENLIRLLELGLSQRSFAVAVS